MELLNRVEVATVTEVTYTFQDDVSTFYYKEWMNDAGEIVDFVIRDKDGHEIDDPELLDEVLSFLDTVNL